MCWMGSKYPSMLVHHSFGEIKIVDSSISSRSWTLSEEQSNKQWQCYWWSLKKSNSWGRLYIPESKEFFKSLVICNRQKNPWRQSLWNVSSAGNNSFPQQFCIYVSLRWLSTGRMNWVSKLSVFEILKLWVFEFLKLSVFTLRATSA